MKNFAITSVLALVLTACETTQIPSETQTKERNVPLVPGQPQAEVWFDGTVEEAFKKASREKSLVFLYWGAVWCPPCNELKANVFSKPKFAELMRGFIPVYLDGDTDQAQVWGERLQASGYPTVLVLDAQQKELFRLASTVNLAEFEEAIQPLLGQSVNFGAALEALQAKRMSPLDWKVLAYADWQQLPKEHGDPKQRVIWLKNAALSCPNNLEKEKALLQASYLGLAAQLGKQNSYPASMEDRKLLIDLLASPKSVMIARSLVVGEVEAIVNWLFPSQKEVDFAKVKDLWRRAAAKIAEDPNVSVETRLNAAFIEIAWYRLETKSATVPDELRTLVQKAVARADLEAQSAFERHAVISTAAYYLRQVRDHKGARELLLAELKTTDTPWYYQSSLANLEVELGNQNEAQQWAAKARQSAQGRATKIQWITNDILLNAKDSSDERHAYLLALAEEYYQLATELNDGFVGRNKIRSQKVQESLLALTKQSRFKELISVYKQKCRTLSGENKEACELHFGAYSKPKEG